MQRWPVISLRSVTAAPAGSPPTRKSGFTGAMLPPGPSPANLVGSCLSRRRTHPSRPRAGYGCSTTTRASPSSSSSSPSTRSSTRRSSDSAPLVRLAAQALAGSRPPPAGQVDRDGAGPLSRAQPRPMCSPGSATRIAGGGSVSVVSYEGGGAFVIRTLSGDAPDELRARSWWARAGPCSPSARRARDLLRPDGAAAGRSRARCARELRAGREPAPAELGLEIGDDGEPASPSSPSGTPQPARDFKQLPEAHPWAAPGASISRDASWGWPCPPTPRWPPTSPASWRPTRVRLDERVRDMLDELTAEHDRAAETVALSYAEDADLDGLVLGGELHPFQRAGVRYALDRRRTFIADEQGLGKTVQALAALEARPGVPRRGDLPGEHEAQLGARDPEVAARAQRRRARGPRRSRVDRGRRARRDRRAQLRHPRGAPRQADRRAAACAGLRRVALRQEPAGPAHQGGAGARGALPPTRCGWPSPGRRSSTAPRSWWPSCACSGASSEFGSGARLTRRFRSAGSDDRLHWNLRARCYVRRTKQQVLPQLPAKRHDTVPMLLSNEHEYRLAEQDVIAWLQTLPLDLRTIDAKVAAALRAEQLVRLNNLRQLAARGKLPTALAWIADFLASGEPLVVFAEHIAIQQAVLERFPDAAHILGADSSPSRQRGRRRLPARGRPAADRLLAEGGVAGHHAHARLERRLPGARLDAGPARPGRGPPAPDRPGQRRHRLVPAGAGHDRRDDGRAAPAQARVIDAITDGQVLDDERLVDAVVRELRGRPFRHLRVVA